MSRKPCCLLDFVPLYQSSYCYVPKLMLPRTPQVPADVTSRAKAAARAKKKELAKKQSKKPKPASMAPTNRSKQIAVDKNLKRASYSPEIVKLVMGLRAASYKMGGTDLAYLFNEIDVDKSGSLDAAEFAKVLRRFVSMNVTDFSASV